MARICVNATWDDSPHLTQQQKDDLWAAIPPHQRSARAKGIPTLGSGIIYAIDEDDILVDPFEIPAYFRRCYAMDVGWNRTAALWGALDPDTDVLFLYDEHYRAQSEPVVHAHAIRARGAWIPGVIDPASRGRSQVDGTQLFQMYQELGLELTIANNAVEAGIYETHTRFSTGRLKVFRSLSNFVSEIRIYRRDEKGKIVKERDHLVDCLRYLINSGLNVAADVPVTQWAGKLVDTKGTRLSTGKGKVQQEFDPWAGTLDVKK